METISKYFRRPCKSLNIENLKQTRGTHYSITVHMLRPRRFGLDVSVDDHLAARDIRSTRSNSRAARPKQSGGR
jgi:hypothetical protein